MLYQYITDHSVSKQYLDNYFWLILQEKEEKLVAFLVRIVIIVVAFLEITVRL